MPQTKPTVILLPGMMSDERLWAPQIMALEGKYDVRVFFFPDHNCIRDMARTVLSKTTGNIAIIGTSMGGYIAQNIALMSPDRVTHLGLFNTNCISDSPEKIKIRTEDINKGESHFISERHRDEYFQQFTYDKNRVDIFSVLRDQALHLGFKTFVNHCTACINRPDVTHNIFELDIPISVIGGKDDKITPIDQQFCIINNARNARLLVLERCGHISSLEKPDDVTHEILKLLDR